MVKQVAIIGGGIIGATAAFYLSYLKGHESVAVTLFDEDTGQATKAASGIISPWLSKRRNKRWYALAKQGAELYQQLVNDAQLSANAYCRTGTIVTRTDHADLLDLYHEAEIKAAQTPAMGNVELLSSAEVKRRMPILTNPPEGVFVSGGARIDGQHFVAELLANAQQENLAVVNQRVSLDGSGRVLTEQGPRQFDRIIVATGAWMHETLKPLGLSLKVRPQKGQLIDLLVDMPASWDNMPVMMPESMSDIIPFNHGKLVVGATHENDGGFDLTPKEAAKNQLFENAQYFIEQLSKAQITDMRVGTRAYTDDFSPFFGILPTMPSILVGGGLGSSGLTTGPMIGYHLAQSILSSHLVDWNHYTKPIGTYIS